MSHSALRGLQNRFQRATVAENDYCNWRERTIGRDGEDGRELQT